MLLITIVVIAAELAAPFKNFFAGITGHHWTARGIFGVLLFILLTLIFNAKSGSDDLGKSINLVIVSAVSGTIVLFLFYTIHYVV